MSQDELVSCERGSGWSSHHAIITATMNPNAGQPTAEAISTAGFGYRIASTNLHFTSNGRTNIFRSKDT